MKNYQVVITQKLTGSVDIEAENEEAALEKAQKKYGADGYPLPDMDDINDLEFEIKEIIWKK